MKQDKPNKNRPSRLYAEKIGSNVYFEDERYCAGHKSNGRYHKKMTRILRSKLKEETNRLINNEETE